MDRKVFDCNVLGMRNKYSLPGVICMQGINKIEITVVVLLTVVARFSAALITGGLFHPDVYEHEQLANNILNGKGYVGILDGDIYSSMMYPLYPYLNAGIYYITGHSQPAMISVQIIISCFSSILVVLIGRDLMKSPAPFVAGIIASLHPGLIVYSTNKIHEVNLVILFVLLSVFLVFHISNNFSYKKVLCISFLFAAAIYTRVVMAFFPLLLLIVIPGNVRRRINTLLLLIIFCFSFVLLWNYRNYRIHGMFVFSTMNAYNFYMGNNVDAIGTEYTKENKSIRSVIQEKEKEMSMPSMDESQRYVYYKERATAFIVEDPVRFVQLTFKRIYYFWWFSPHTGIEYPKYYFQVFKYFYICLLVFAFIGISDPCLYSTKNKKNLLFIILLTVVVISLTQSLVYVHYRHRASIELLMVLFSANGFSRILRWLQVDLLKDREKNNSRTAI